MRTAFLALVSCVIAIGVAAGQASKPASSAALPDWSGVWQMVGPTVFFGHRTDTRALFTLHVDTPLARRGTHP